MIFSSDQDYTLWPQPGTELTIDLESTRLNLPVVGGQESLMAALPQGSSGSAEETQKLSGE